MTTPTTTDAPAAPGDATEVPAVAHIYQAMRAIMAEVRGVPKTGELKNRGEIQYHCQRYEDMVEKVGDACRDHLVFLQSEVKEQTVTTWDKAASSGSFVTKWARAVVVKRFTFTSLVDGSTLTVEATGEGSDSSDKAVNKAETSSLKNALRHGLLLSTRDDRDPDAERPGEEVPRETVRNSRPPEQPAPAQSEGALDVPGTLTRLVESARTKAQTKADIGALWTWAAERKLLDKTPPGEQQELAMILRASAGMLPDGPS